MKKIIFLFLMLTAQLSWAANWFVCVDTGGAGAGTLSDPWDGLNEIVWGGAGMMDGDTLYLMPGT